MSNYRRLISYIYAYEGGVKGKNIGFAKLEARNGQCKIQVNVKKIYIGSSDMGVYLLTEGKEILLGNMFVRNGSGEFRTMVSVSNVEQSGCTMEQCFGMTIHAADDHWQTYTTIWEDAAAQAVHPSEGSGKTGAETSAASGGETGAGADGSAEMMTYAAEIGAGTAMGSVAGREGRTFPDRVELTAETALRDVTYENRIQEEMEASLDQVAGVPVFENEPGPESFVQELEREIEEQAAEDQKEEDVVDEPVPFEENETIEPQEPVGQEPMEQPVAASQQMPIGNPELLARLEREELEENQPERLWQYFRSNYPKVEAFDYQGESEILMIKPQDIGLLPRETWNFGNNSFLLHGYYNYRYLTLSRLKTPQGANRYLLGVPGHYYSNEKYMASMFGFPHFVLAKMQPAGDGRFGYWYSDINLGN